MDRIQGVPPSIGSDVGAQFDTAIQKIETAPKKARSKIPADTVTRLRADQAQTRSASGRAQQLSGSGSRAAASGRQADPALGGRFALATAAGLTDGAGPQGTYTPPALATAGGGTNAETEGAQVRAAMSQIAADQARQVAVNQSLSLQLQGLTRESQALTSQISAASARKTKAQQAAISLDQSSKSVQMSAQGLVATAGQLQQVASGLALVPFAGWALAGALTAVAMVLQGVAGGLAKSAMGLQQKSLAMLNEAQGAMQLESTLIGQRALLEARRQGTNARLIQGKQRLTQIQRAQVETKQAGEARLRSQGEGTRGGAGGALARRADQRTASLLLAEAEADPTADEGLRRDLRAAVAEAPERPRRTGVAA